MGEADGVAQAPARRGEPGQQVTGTAAGVSADQGTAPRSRAGSWARPSRAASTWSAAGVGGRIRAPALPGRSITARGWPEPSGP
jgi:hypothetical protein